MQQREQQRANSAVRLERWALLVVSSIWVIVQNNARIGDNIPDDTSLVWLTVPREMRLVEAATLLSFFVLHQPGLWRSQLRDLTVVIWLFLLVAVAAMLRQPTQYVS